MDGRRARLGILAFASCVAVAVPTSASGETVTFLPTGDEQAFTVPAGVSSVHVAAVGGRGGDGGSTGGDGGFGALAIADLAVTPGQVLYVQVGGNGEDGAAGGAGGFNGGGTGGAVIGVGGGGGGASDVRTASRAAGTSLTTRLITAAGGGGGGASTPSPPYVNDGGSAGAAATGGGGYGGGGEPGTASMGGSGSNGCVDAEDGALGLGGGGGGGPSCGFPGSGGGGGGGGLYGGGGGGASSAGDGGGGGSSGFGPGAINTSLSTDNTGAPSISITYEQPPEPTPPGPKPPAADTDPPETTITKGAPNRTEKSKVKFKFESNEPGSTFECKKDKKPFKPCSSPTKMKRLDGGKHTFKVRATDPAGNTGPAAKDKFRVVG